jgi:hypothetical protein
MASNLEKANAQGDLLTGDDRWKIESPVKLATWHNRAANLQIETLRLVALIQERVKQSPAKNDPESGRWRTGIHGTLDRVTKAAEQLREQFFASEMRQRFSDSSGASTDRALIDWNLEPTRAHAEMVEHVLARPPRRSPDARG